MRGLLVVPPQRFSRSGYVLRPNAQSDPLLFPLNFWRANRLPALDRQMRICADVPQPRFIPELVSGPGTRTRKQLEIFGRSYESSDARALRVKTTAWLGETTRHGHCIMAIHRPARPRWRGTCLNTRPISFQTPSCHSGRATVLLRTRGGANVTEKNQV